jgi:hypothetical protein
VPLAVAALGCFGGGAGGNYWERRRRDGGSARDEPDATRRNEAALGPGEEGEGQELEEGKGRCMPYLTVRTDNTCLWMLCAVSELVTRQPKLRERGEFSLSC